MQSRSNRWQSVVPIYPKDGNPRSLRVTGFPSPGISRRPQVQRRSLLLDWKSKLHSAIGKWQRRLQRLFELAGIPAGHAHRFRDTFAVELLLARVPLERVSVLLGHQSIRVTERHYSPWVRERQEQLESDLKRAWSEDPIALIEGTQQVHDKSERPN